MAAQLVMMLAVRRVVWTAEEKVQAMAVVTVLSMVDK